MPRSSHICTAWHPWHLGGRRRLRPRFPLRFSWLKIKVRSLTPAATWAPWRQFSGICLVADKPNQSRSADALWTCCARSHTFSNSRGVLSGTSLLVASVVRHAAYPGMCSCQGAKVHQTRVCAGLTDPMGTWCIWLRPQAESVVTPTQQSSHRLGSD